MKKLALVLLFFISCPVYAGFSSFNNEIDYIEPINNLMYSAVLKVKNNKDLDHSFISNYNSDEGEISFSKDYRIRNNRGIKNRLIKDKLCIYTYESETKTYSLWYCTKLGQNLKRVKSFNRDTNWWIDIKNSKIYFVRQIEDKLHVESIEW